MLLSRGAALFFGFPPRFLDALASHYIRLLILESRITGVLISLVVKAFNLGRGVRFIVSVRVVILRLTVLFVASAVLLEGFLVRSLGLTHFALHWLLLNVYFVGSTRLLLFYLNHAIIAQALILLIAWLLPRLLLHPENQGSRPNIFNHLWRGLVLPLRFTI